MSKFKRIPEWRGSALVLNDIEKQLDIYSLSNLPVLHKIPFMLYAFNYIVASVFVFVSMFYSTTFIFLSDFVTRAPINFSSWLEMVNNFLPLPK